MTKTQFVLNVLAVLVVVPIFAVLWVLGYLNEP